MDTKSKNTTNHLFVKLAAALLAVVCGCLSALSAYAILTTENEFGVITSGGRDLSALAEPDDELFFTSFLFYNTVKDDLRALQSMLMFRNDDYFEQTYLPARIQALEEAIEQEVTRQIQDERYNVGSEMSEQAIRDSVTAQANYNKQHQESILRNQYIKAKNATGALVNLRYVLVDTNSGEVLTNLPDATAENAALLVRSYPWYALRTNQGTFDSSANTENRPQYFNADSMDAQNGVSLYLAMNTTFSGQDHYRTLYQYFQQTMAQYQTALVAFAGSTIVFLLALAVLIALAGRGMVPEPGTDAYRQKVLSADGRRPVLRSWIDKLPSDLHMILSGLGLIGCVGIARGCYVGHEPGSTYLVLEIALICSALAAAGLIAEFCTFFARQAKAGVFFRNMLFLRPFRWIWRKLRQFFNSLKAFGHHFESLPKYIVLLLAIYTAVSFVLSFIPFALMIFNIIVLPVIWQSIVALDRLMQIASSIQDGDLNQQLDMRTFPVWLRPFAQDIIKMRDGMRQAVDEAVKGERMKTELITNVSHDLKTPLTSIINYVDLLSRCAFQDEKAGEYLDVLKNKSQRLKHLIEDLTEASKASTGNIQFQKVNLNLYELAVQAVGENEDAITAQGIAVCVNTPEREPIVWADGQKTWRIIDNLLSNVRKYSVPGTRAYIDVWQENGWGVLCVKNISREQLNIPPEELMQRFVRGDQSRSTEGSGLGLSIAQNLCEKQGGRFAIAIDGDMFKATIALPLATQQTPPSPAEPASSSP